MVITTILRALMGPGPATAGDEPADRAGLVVVADGIGGLELCATGLARVIARRGLPLELHHVRWGHGVGRWYADLTRTANLRRHADEAADDVRAALAARPDRPVFLVGKSGGAGVVARALEQLPEASVERAVMLAPALSATYDLSGALRAIRRELVVFYSPLDFVLLGAGTRLFGTVDRVRGVGAGLVGFREPAGLDADGRDRYRDRLRQVRWRPSMARSGYLGGHVAVDLPPFLGRYVAPLLRPGPLATGWIEQA